MSTSSALPHFSPPKPERGNPTSSVCLHPSLCCHPNQSKSYRACSSLSWRNFFLTISIFSIAWKPSKTIPGKLFSPPLPEPMKNHISLDLVILLHPIYCRFSRIPLPSDQISASIHVINHPRSQKEQWQGMAGLWHSLPPTRSSWWTGRRWHYTRLDKSSLNAPYLIGPRDPGTRCVLLVVPQITPT